VAKYVRYEHGDGIHHGELREGSIYRLEGTIGDFHPTQDSPVALADVRLLAPTVPSKIIAIGPNYKTMFAGGEFVPPPQPSLWFKSPTGLNDPEGIIELPPGHVVNHECELAIVIGRRAKAIEQAQARDYVFGYTCMNDVTGGDMSIPQKWQATHYLIDGKIFDTFAPLGPVIETDLDPRNLHLECRVNGEVRQSHSTSDFLFDPDFVVSLVSQVLTLFPGDVISTGSPPGLAHLHDGDTVEVEIENIGVLRNYARARPGSSAD
jgi:2-keto-4-pentenoate hydratase/2-oxohepta-3-ene-1,7-dioic acid hydratase in catechol pathway